MISAVIVAGGKGKRMGMNINKPYIKFNEHSKEILALSIGVFNEIKDIDEIIIVTGEDEIEYCRNNIIEKYGFNKVKKVVGGGRERQASVFIGLEHCDRQTEYVLIHDGARPFITEKMVENSINCVKEFGACSVAVPIKDTIKTLGEDMYLENSLDRSKLYSIQTPQSFNYKLIMRAHREALENGIIATDDTMLVEKIGEKVKIVPGSYFNIKITTSEDLIMGRAILENFNFKEGDII